MLNYLYAAFIAAILITTPITIILFVIEKKLKEEIFYTPLISVLIFTFILLYTLSNRITYIGDFF